MFTPGDVQCAIDADMHAEEIATNAAITINVTAKLAGETRVVVLAAFQGCGYDVSSDTNDHLPKYLVPFLGALVHCQQGCAGCRLLSRLASDSDASREVVRPAWSGQVHVFLSSRAFPTTVKKTLLPMRRLGL